VDITNLIPKLEGFRILYIEDDSDVRDSMMNYLRKLDVPVYEGRDGEEGWELYERHKPDIMIIDLKMPRLNGIDLAKRIRETDNRTQIVILTAYTEPEYMIEAVELNIARYLVKPISKATLLPAIEKCVDALTIEKKHPAEFDFGEGCSYNFKRKVLQKNGEAIKVNKREIAIVELFIENKDDVVTYAMIEGAVWGQKQMSMDAIRTLVKGIRQKTYQDLIDNLSGIGYALNLERVK
jgi:two-component system, OmpR family, response regulator VanR